MMQVMACSKNSFNYGETLKIKFKELKRVQFSCWSTAQDGGKQTRHPYEGIRPSVQTWGAVQYCCYQPFDLATVSPGAFLRVSVILAQFYSYSYCCPIQGCGSAWVTPRPAAGSWMCSGSWCLTMVNAVGKAPLGLMSHWHSHIWKILTITLKGWIQWPVLPLPSPTSVPPLFLYINFLFYSDGGDWD